MNDDESDEENNAPSEDKRDVTEINLEYFHSLTENETLFASPINLNIAQAKILILPTLTWSKHNAPPKKVKITNTGNTNDVDVLVNISAKWVGERPCLLKGPFTEKYVFSQIHFHWGENISMGSEHTADGVRYPLEMHVVYYKLSYRNQEAALQHNDGVAILVYLFQLQETENHALQVIVDILQDLKKANSSQKMTVPLPLNFIVKEFCADYLLYWGTIATTSCMHLVMWIISREPYGLALEQMSAFYALLNKDDEPLMCNVREIQPRKENDLLFHVNPSPSLYATLLHPRRDLRVITD